MHEKLHEIHMSLVNGQRKQMVNQIDDYGLYEFFNDYQNHLRDQYVEIESAWHYFVDAVISYPRIKNR